MEGHLEKMRFCHLSLFARYFFHSSSDKYMKIIYQMKLLMNRFKSSKVTFKDRWIIYFKIKKKIKIKMPDGKTRKILSPTIFFAVAFDAVVNAIICLCGDCRLPLSV